MIKRMIRMFFLATLTAQPVSVFPADHVDGPAARADPAADLADVYAWMTADTEQVNLALTIPAALFSDAVQYVFEVESSEALGEAGSLTRVICSFDEAQTIQCWVGEDDYVTGIASEEVGLTSRSGRIRVFAGLRDDPFFFNSIGFNAVRTQIRDTMSELEFDEAGCPLLDSETSQTLINQLTEGANTFVNPVSALVLQIDRSLLARGGDILAVSGSTHRT